MRTTETAAMASNGDNAIRSSTVIADHPCIRLAASASRVLNWRLSLSQSANPIATSAAAILRIKRYLTCPSACAHLAPAVTKANPVAFNIISSDINMKTMLRRASTPISPNAKSAPANNNPYSIGIEAIMIPLVAGSQGAGERESEGAWEREKKYLSSSPCLPLSRSPALPLSRSLALPLSRSFDLHSPITPQVISADHPRQQQQRSQFDAEQVGAEERDAHLFRLHGAGGRGAERSARDDERQLPDEDERENRRSDPRLRAQPLTLLRRGARPQVEQHDHEDEENHNRAGVDDHFQRGGEGRAQREEDHRHRQQRDDQIEQRVNRVQPSDHHHGRYQRHRRRNVECCVHHIRFQVSGSRFQVSGFS